MEMNDLEYLELYLQAQINDWAITIVNMDVYKIVQKLDDESANKLLEIIKK